MPVDDGLQFVKIPDAYKSLTFRHGATTFRNGLFLTVHLWIARVTGNRVFLILPSPLPPDAKAADGASVTGVVLAGLRCPVRTD
jgi:hypothetical protein